MQHSSNSIPNIKITSISSPQNPKVKEAAKLRESKYRRRSKTFLVEGEREILRAIEGGFEVTTLFMHEEFDSASVVLKEIFACQQLSTVFSLNNAAYSKLALRDSTEKITAVFKNKMLEDSELELANNAVVCLLDGVEKPGNLGAILRSCDGAGVDLVVVTGQGTDLFNPNTIRTSVGAIFKNKIVCLEEQEAFEMLARKKAKFYGAVLSDKSKVFYESDLSSFDGVRVICMGTEANGLSEFWLGKTEHVIIPMRGVSDSLNVSVASAILVYEATKTLK